MTVSALEWSIDCIFDHSAEGQRVLCRYCRGCIEPAVYSSSGQVCPACAREGTETFLGHDPFASQRLQPDFSVDTIIRKLLPPDVRWHLRRAQCKVWPPGWRHDVASTIFNGPV